jgi:predicted transcriptional regulator
MTILTIQLTLSDEALARLKEEAQERKLPIEVLISERLEDEFNEPTEAEILETIRQSMRDSLAGNTRPVDEVLAELEDEKV